jgi:hypothetical protein
MRRLTPIAAGQSDRSGGAPGGQVGGEERSADDDERRAHERGRIERAHGEEQSLQPPGDYEGHGEATGDVRTRRKFALGCGEYLANSLRAVHDLAASLGRGSQSVLRNAISARLSSAGRFNPYWWPGMARARVSGGFQPFGR